MINDQPDCLSKLTMHAFYTDDAGQPTLRDSVVVFLDILGFEAMSTEAKDQGEQNELLRRLCTSLDQARRWSDPYAHDEESRPYEVRTFTDHIVAAWPISGDAEGELGHSWLVWGSYQLALALDGFFVRGGIALGPACVAESVVFGPAVIEAYRIESRIAKHPRLALSETAAQRARAHLNYYHDANEAPQNRAVCVDADGTAFVNYLEAALSSEEDKLDAIANHAARIHEQLIQHRIQATNVWDKFAWLASYHNWFVRTHAFPDSYLVPNNALERRIRSLAQE